LIKYKPFQYMRKITGLLLLMFLTAGTYIYGQKKVEKLDRSVIAIRTSVNTVFVQWRLLGTEPDDIAFNVYRGTTLINGSPITGATNLTDNVTTDETYTVKAIIGGNEQAASPSASVLVNNYFDIPLTPPGIETMPDATTCTFNANDCSAADLDGDGEYEIILKWDPSNSRDNSLSGYTGNVYIDAYKLNGTRLWRINLGKNIRAGAHYTQFMVYDFDSDGKAEMVCKTADGTTDAAGTLIGSSTADYRNATGYVLSGPEYLTIFNGETGTIMQTINYDPPRGTVSSWGDSYGNRVDRFLAGVAYLDGVNPSVIMCRGYYTRTVLVAYDWNGTNLTKRWTFDSNTSGNSAYAGQGNHSLSIADVDFDGKDEIIYGACAIDDNGTGLYSTGLRHGDALHVSDMDPARPGLEVWQCHEESAGYPTAGGEFRDAFTGQMIFGVPAVGDVGRALAADIDLRFPGFELWTSGDADGDGSGDNKLYTNKGVNFATKSLSKNVAIWWDGDRTRELFDNTSISKYNGPANSYSAIFSPTGCTTNNGTKKNPCLSGDIIGDWREELMLPLADNSALRVFITNAATTTKLYTLMHDPQYRVAIAWQNTAYNQPPHLSFYLADGYEIPKQNIVEVGNHPTTYTLNTTVSGQGNLYTSPAGLSYVDGSIVRLVAIPKSNNTFTNFSGDVTDVNDTIYVTMDAAKNISVNFTNNATTFTLTSAVPGGNGTIILSPSASPYQYNSIVTANANWTAGYKLDAWGGDLAGIINPASLTMTSDKSITAAFSRIHPTGTFVEAESGTFSNPSGTTVDFNYVGFTGTGFVNTDNAVGTYVDIPVTVGAAGSYEIVVYYANNSSARGFTIAVNGAQTATFTGAPTGAWTTWANESFTTDLLQGSSTIRLTSNTAGGLPNVDKIELVYLGVSGIQGSAFAGNNFNFVSQHGSIVLYSNILSPLTADILITDITGRKVSFGNYEFDLGEKMLDLSAKGLRTGVYLCQIISERGETKTWKVVVE
jgi:rhamnogalacturonan endolyase